MTTSNAELRALAEKATPGAWKCRHAINGQIVESTASRYPNSYDPVLKLIIDHQNADDARYIAAAHPARIIELLSQLDSRDEQIADQIEHIAKWESWTHKAEDETTALRAKLEAAEHQIHRLEREIEESSKRTTLISETGARRRNKLDIAMRALEFYADRGQWDAAAYDDVHYAADEDRGETARQALAQLKEQP